jgi:hypothetical protein
MYGVKNLSPTMTLIVVLVGGFAAGVILVGLGHWFIGIMVACAAIPVALVAWLTAGERM